MLMPTQCDSGIECDLSEIKKYAAVPMTKTTFSVWLSIAYLPVYISRFYLQED